MRELEKVHRVVKESRTCGPLIRPNSSRLCSDEFGGESRNTVDKIGVCKDNYPVDASPWSNRVGRRVDYRSNQRGLVMLSLRCHCGTGLRVEPAPGDDVILSACRSCLAPFMVRIAEIHAVDLTDIPAVPNAGLYHPGNLPADSLMARVLPLVSESIDALPVLPEVAQRVIAAIHDPLADMREIARLLGEDAVLGARVLQLANSAAYGGTSRIQALPEACARLGMKRIAHIVHMTSQADVYRNLGRSYRDFLGRLWRHSIAAAHCIETVGCRARLRVDQTPFLAGLSHDIGKLVLADAILNRYTGQIGELENSPEKMLAAVAEFHALAGLHAVQKWGLPSDVSIAVYFQSHPASAPPGHGQMLAMAVQLASAMATQAGFSVTDADQVEVAELPAISAFELNVQTLNEYCEQLPELLEPVLEAFVLA